MHNRFRQIGLGSARPKDPKIVVIRDDDIIDDTAALRWFCNTIIAKDAKAVLAVQSGILTANGLTYLNTLDSDKFEFCPHGYGDNAVEDRMEAIPLAYADFFDKWGAYPPSISAPNSITPAGWQDLVLSLGYHSHINNFGGTFEPPRKIFTFPWGFAWEDGWGSDPNWYVHYDTLEHFKSYFDDWYNGYASPATPHVAGRNPRVFCVSIHHLPLSDDYNPTAAQGRADFAASLDYIKSKGDVVFMTEEQAYQAIKGSTAGTFETIFSDGFESNNFLNTSGVGGAWDVADNTWWTIRTNWPVAGTYHVGTSAHDDHRLLAKNINFDVSKQYIIDLYVRAAASSAVAWDAVVLAGPTESVKLLSLQSAHFKYYDSAYKNLPVDKTYVAVTWYHVQIYVDFYNSVVSYVIDSEYKGSVTLRTADTLNLVSPSLSLTQLQHWNCAAGGTSTYMDSVIVQKEIA